MATKYHYSPKTNKPEKCSSPDNCLYGETNNGVHYDSLAEALAAVEEKNTEELGLFQKVFKRKKPFKVGAHGFKYYGEVPESKEAQKAELAKLSGEDKLFRAAEFRRFNGEDAYARVKEEFSQEELELHTKYFNDVNRIATFGLVKEYGIEDSDTAGLVFDEGYSDDESRAVSKIMGLLKNGESLKDLVTYTEDNNGVAVLHFDTGNNWYAPQNEEEPYSHEDAVKETQKRFDSYQNNRQFWKVNDSNMAELRAEYKGKIEPLPKKKEELIKAALAYEKANWETPVIPPFSPGSATKNGGLRISSSDPLVKTMMKNTRDAAENGTLKVGRADNIHGGVIFYDSRDTSSEALQKESIKNRKVKEAADRIAPVEKKLKEAGGMVYAVSPRVEWDGDSSTSSYWLNYGVPDNKRDELFAIAGESPSRQIFGHFNEKDLEKIATGDYSVLKKD